MRQGGDALRADLLALDAARRGDAGRDRPRRARRARPAAAGPADRPLAVAAAIGAAAARAAGPRDAAGRPDGGGARPAVAPLAEILGVLADIESKGGATVYRFTPESVRRALDAGRSAAELQAFLAAHSRTPVPQPLSYLIDDVARRHGTLRVGAAAAYLRCDDDSLLTELLADRRANGLGLRRLAPTVVAAQADPVTLLERLRAMGLAPAAESADGDVVITRADAHRTPPRAAPVPVTEGPPSRTARCWAPRSRRSARATAPPPPYAAPPRHGGSRTRRRRPALPRHPPPTPWPPCRPPC